MHAGYRVFDDGAPARPLFICRIQALDLSQGETTEQLTLVGRPESSVAQGKLLISPGSPVAKPASVTSTHTPGYGETGTSLPVSTAHSHSIINKPFSSFYFNGLYSQ